MDESIGSVDRISGLPDFILHHIVTFLSNRDAARICILSKRWQYIWETFPFVDCNEFDFGMDLSVLNPKELKRSKSRRRKTFNLRLKFMNYVDYKLRRLCEENLCVKKFRLNMTLVNINLAPRVDKWLELVTDLKVQELDLDIRVGKERFYNLPWKVLASQTVTVLSLKGCLLSNFLSNSATKLKFVVELTLGNSLMDEETIQSVISYFTLMEVFTLDYCWGFRRVDIYGHDKLKKMKYISHFKNEVEKFNIEILSLEELDFDFGRYTDEEEMGCDLNVSSVCQNLKRLSLKFTPFRGSWVQKMISSFSKLEYLYLGGFNAEEEVFKLSSTILKELHLSCFNNLAEAELDTPNLHKFKYYSRYMPLISSNNVAGIRIARLIVDPEDKIDHSWFVRLSNFLRCGRFQELRLRFVREVPLTTLDAKHFTEIQPSLPFELENIKLELYTRTSANCVDFLDGLLCTVHPKTLSLRLSFLSTESVQTLLNSLVSERSDSGGENLNYWRNSLKDITFIGLKGGRFDIPLDPSALKLLTKHDDQLNSRSLHSLYCFLNILVMDAANVCDLEWLYFNLSWRICE